MVASALEGLHADTVVPDHDLLADMDLVHGFAVGASVLDIHDNGNIHLDMLDIDPLSLHAHLGWQVGCGIELIGQHAILLDGCGVGVVRVCEDGPDLL